MVMNQKMTTNPSQPVNENDGEDLVKDYSEKEFNAFPSFWQWSRSRESKMIHNTWNNPLDFHGYSSDESMKDLSAMKLFTSEVAKKEGR
jgi:hypothetical protein